MESLERQGQLDRGEHPLLLHKERYPLGRPMKISNLLNPPSLDRRSLCLARQRFSLVNNPSVLRAGLLEE